MAYSNILGIDLGTTNTCIAILKDKIPKIINNLNRKTTTPSYVSYINDKIVVGEEAKNNQPKNPFETIFAVKRLIGKKSNDKSLKEYLQTLPYKLHTHDNGDTWIKIKDKLFSPVKISSDILQYVKTCVNNFLVDKKLKDAIITVPAYFDDVQRQATKDAGKIAGLNVVRVINEPTAAALAYGLNKKGVGNVAVYDLGGGTFDISILNVKDGVFDVISVNGNGHLGGEDIDIEVMKNIIGHFFDENKILDDKKVKDAIIKSIDENFVSINNKYSKEAKTKDKKLSHKNSSEQESISMLVSVKKMQELKETVEKAKIALSSCNEFSIKIPNFAEHSIGGNKDLIYTLSRKELEEIAKPIIDKTINPCMLAIKDSSLKLDQIDHVILVGGMTKMPLVRQTVSEIFKKMPNTSVDPDHAVAMGAAIQGGIMEGIIEDVILLDVCNLSLGIETLGGFFSKIIDRNTTIPCKKTERFTTSEDDQEEVVIKIYQGERALVKDNKFLGEIRLKDIPRASKGVPVIEVSFENDADGICKVKAYDSLNKKESKIEIKPASGLTEKEISNIIEESERNKKIDEHAVRCLKMKLEIEKLLKFNMIKSKEDMNKLNTILLLDVFDLNEVKNIIQRNL